MKELEKLDLIKLVQELHDEHKKVDSLVTNIDRNTADNLNNFLDALTQMKSELKELYCKIDALEKHITGETPIHTYFKLEEKISILESRLNNLQENKELLKRISTLESVVLTLKEGMEQSTSKDEEIELESLFT